VGWGNCTYVKAPNGKTVLMDAGGTEALPLVIWFHEVELELIYEALDHQK